MLYCPCDINTGRAPTLTDFANRGLISDKDQIVMYISEYKKRLIGGSIVKIEDKYYLQYENIIRESPIVFWNALTMHLKLARRDKDTGKYYDPRCRGSVQIQVVMNGQLKSLYAINNEYNQLMYQEYGVKSLSYRYDTQTTHIGYIPTDKDITEFINKYKLINAEDLVINNYIYDRYNLSSSNYVFN